MKTLSSLQSEFCRFPNAFGRCNRFVPSLLLPLILSIGCSANFGSVPVSTTTVPFGTITGSVRGGQQPVVGSLINLYAASTAGYGAASTLLTPAPVITGPDGAFVLTGAYTCTAGQQVYLTAIGGDPSGSNQGTNPQIGLMGVLGTCPVTGMFALTLPNVLINEVSTVAAAYAMAPFAIDATHVGSSGTPAALTGIANAFGNAAKFFDITGASGQGSLVQLPGAQSYARALPSEALADQVANILASCVNTEPSGNTPSAICSTLLNAATSDGTPTGLAPTETATAAINIAHHPAANVATLYGLIGATPPFGPAGYQFPYQPVDFALFVVYYANALDLPSAIAIDAQGNAWVPSSNSAASFEITPAGSIMGGENGFPFYGNGIAISASGNLWLASYGAGFVKEYSPSGTLSYVYAPNSPDTPIAPGGLALDKLGNVWVPDTSHNNLIILASAGGVNSQTSLSTYNNSIGFLNFDNQGNGWLINKGGVIKLTAGGSPTGQFTVTTQQAQGYISPKAVALDSSGNAWVADQSDNSVVELSNGGMTLTSSVGITGGGIGEPDGIAVDGLGQVWVGSYASNTGYGVVTELSNSGTILSGAYGYTGMATFSSPGKVAGGIYGAQAVALDGSGDVWVTALGDAFIGNGQSGGVIEFIGAAAPVVTPLTTSVATQHVGIRP
jgi:sugar lactone lactonase YvrE